MADDECWLCAGLNSESCSVCGVVQASPATTALVGQDGWSLPEGTPEDHARLALEKEEKQEDYNMKVLCQAEVLLRKGDLKGAAEKISRVTRNLEHHLDDADALGKDKLYRGMEIAEGVKQPEVRPMYKRGERELLNLAYACEARVYMAQHKFEDAVKSVEEFEWVYKMTINRGNPIRLHKQESILLSMCPKGTTFLRHMGPLSDAMVIADNCRRRVEDGVNSRPKVVMEETLEGLQGIRPVSEMAMPGIDSLRAHLHQSRAHAAMEIRRWDEAKEDAAAMLALKPGDSEAKYMLECAEAEDW